MRKNGKRGTRMVKVDNALLVVQTRGGEILCCIIVIDKSRRPLSHHAAALICSGLEKTCPLRSNVNAVQAVTRGGYPAMEFYR